MLPSAKSYSDLSKDELQKLYEGCKKQYDDYKSQGLNLDMSRGKPGADQLDLSMDLLNILEPGDYKASDGTDCRNYGGLDGIPEMKKIFADLMEVKTEEILVGGNASLTLMYESVCIQQNGNKSQNYQNSQNGQNYQNSQNGKIKHLCPAPGYDRHFTIAEHFDIELIPITMTQEGPDIAEIKKHIQDSAVTGIWCVPVYSNPQGIVYSDRVIKEMAALKPKSENFRIFWDNAYVAHALEGDPPKIANILRECEKCGSYDMPIIFSSFSKITFPGAGVCAMAASPNNLEKMKKLLFVQTIGPDKMNQLRHARYFKDVKGVHSHMKKHSGILAPKFKVVTDALTAKLKGKEIGTWIEPKGGYFISFDALPGTAQNIVTLCKEAGLIMTPAGATYPYGKDPKDSNIRIAPTFPSLDQLKQAMELFCVAVELAALEMLLN